VVVDSPPAAAGLYGTIVDTPRVASLSSLRKEETASHLSTTDVTAGNIPVHRANRHAIGARRIGIEKGPSTWYVARSILMLLRGATP
jgi:hypothetical protein